MKPSHALALALGITCLPAQEKQPAKAGTLPQFRAAFAAVQVNGPTIAIACVAGAEPVLLTAGTDAGGQELSPQSLLPLLGLAKVLAADAIAAQNKDQIDKGSGAKLGDRELTVRELLDGTTLLPDYFVIDGSEGSADAAVLRACGALAVGAKLQLRSSSLGAAEFVLLEPLAFGGRYQDWPTMLRSSLAPRVPGLDPSSADTLPEAARARLLLPAEDFTRLAAARPALLRTLLSVKDLATWWQWRSQQDALLWASARMGRLGPAMTRPKEQRWMFSFQAMNMNLHASHYPSQKAGLVWLGPTPTSSWASNTKALQAFEADLFADSVAETAGGGQVAVAGGLAGGLAGPGVARPAATGGPLAGTGWCSAPAADGSSVFKLAFGEGAKGPLLLTLGADTASFATTHKSGDGFTANGRSGDGAQRSLWLWPQPDADKPTRLGVVMVISRPAGRATATGGGWTGSAVPQFVELVPDAR